MSHISSYDTDIVLQTAVLHGRPVEEDPGWEILSGSHLCAEEMDLGGGAHHKRLLWETCLL